MILKDSFYNVQSLEVVDNNLEANIVIDPKHTIFDGHFPGNPITPGVVQMEIIKELLSVHFGKKANLKTMGNCKFLAILNPNETPQVSVKLSLTTQEDGSIKIAGQLATDKGACLKISAVYLLD